MLLLSPRSSYLLQNFATRWRLTTLTRLTHSARLTRLTLPAHSARLAHSACTAHSARLAHSASPANLACPAHVAPGGAHVTPGDVTWLTVGKSAPWWTVSATWPVMPLVNPLINAICCEAQIVVYNCFHAMSALWWRILVTWSWTTSCGRFGQIGITVVQSRKEK